MARAADPDAGRTGHPGRQHRRLHRGRADRADQPLRPGGVPGADAAGGRPGPAVPLHLGPVDEPGRVRPRAGERRGPVRPGEGAGGAAAVPAGRLARAAAAARGDDRALPVVAVPGHGGGRARGVPRHPRCRLRGLGRGRRPAGGGGAGAAPAPVWRCRPARGGQHRQPRHGAAAARRHGRVGGPGVRHRRHARSGRRRPDRRPRPARAALRPVDAGDAAAAGRHHRPLATCSRRCGAATCWCTCPTTRSRPRSSCSCGRPPRTGMWSGSRPPCTAPATTRRCCRR